MAYRKIDKYSFLLLFTILIFINLLFLFTSSCSTHDDSSRKAKMVETNIIFLHHSTGERIWRGDQTNIFVKLRHKLLKESAVSWWFKKYNKVHHTNYRISDRYFPKKTPYGWNNYPFDYYNIWVKHAGDKPYKEEPTLEILSRKYNVVIWKHCFPTSYILPDTETPNIDSEKKTLGNYKLQYEALKRKMHEFPNTKFIVWTGASLLKEATNKENAIRARRFFDWVRNQWDEPDDNIYLWDFYQLETGGGLYMKAEYASGKNDSHPNPVFAKRVYPLFCQRIVDIIKHNGKNTKLTGKPI